MEGNASPMSVVGLRPKASLENWETRGIVWHLSPTPQTEIGSRGAPEPFGGAALLLGAARCERTSVGGSDARGDGAGRGAGAPAGPRGHTSHRRLDRAVLQGTEGLTIEVQLLQAFLHVSFPFRSMKRKLYTMSFAPWHWLPALRAADRVAPPVGPLLD